MTRPVQNHPVKYERHYRDTLPVKGVSTLEGSQLTPLSRNKGKLAFNCDMCELPFEKYACWAKRSAHHYCSRACASAAKVVRVEVQCVVCDSKMMVKPAYLKRVTTCSKECMRKKRVKNNSQLRTSPDYKSIIERLHKQGACNMCGTTAGPWSVLGIRTWVENGLAQADGANAKLYCRHCHMKEVSPLMAKSLYATNRTEYYASKDRKQV